MLINLSNHPYDKWSEKQKEAAQLYGKVVDLPFPAVTSTATEKDIVNLAGEVLDRIVGMLDSDPDSAVMVQGEFTLTFALVNLLRERGIRAISACSERRVTELAGDDGNPKKEVEFCFEGFREYR